MRGSAIVLYAAISFIRGCDPPTPPASSDATIDFSHFRLDLGHPPGRSIDRQFTFYAGAPVESFRFNLKVSGLQGRISVGNGTGGLVEEITSDGDHTTGLIPGNVGQLRVETSGAAAQIVVESLAVTRAGAPAFPAVVAMGNRVSAFPLSPGRAVDIGFSSAPSSFYFSISALSEGMIDIGYFGAGRLRIARANDPNFPLSDSGLWDEVPGPASSLPFTHVRVGNGDSILMSATNDAAASATGHARIVIMGTSDGQKLAFPSETPWNFMVHPLGVDHDSAAGSRGPGSGALDCLNFENKRAIQQTPVGWVPALGIPVCYDTHKGTDFLLRGGPAAQAAGVPVNAAASGVILAVDATHADKCFADPLQGFAITCLGGSAPVDNFVAVRQDDGLIAHYVHVRRDSVGVAPGQRVECGELLGKAGSAGDSAMPHLHFELRRLRDDAFRGPPWFRSLVLSDTQEDTVRFKGDTIDPFGSPSGSEPGRWNQITDGMPESRCP
jgi:hypothetical protein